MFKKANGLYTKFILMLAMCIIAMPTNAAFAAGEVSHVSWPFVDFLNSLASELTGTLPLALGTIAIAAAGIGLLFGNGGAVTQRLLSIICIIGIILFVPTLVEYLYVSASGGSVFGGGSGGGGASVSINLIDQNTEALNAIVDVFKGFCRTAIGALTGPAAYICLLLIVIEFATDWSLYDGSVRMSKFINDIIKGTFFLFIIWNWGGKYGFVNMTESFFTEVGFLAGGASGSKITGPSDILNQGFKICEELYKNFSMSWDDAVKKGYENMSKTENYKIDGEEVAGGARSAIGNYVEGHISAFNPVGILCYLIAILMIIFAHLWIALQLMLCQIEFYIFSGLAVIFVPFGVCKHTKFLFDRVVQGLINFGVKLMGTFFLISVVVSSMKFLDATKVIPANEQFSYYCRVGLVYLCVAFLVWKLPDKFAGMMSGSGPSISGGEALGAAVGAAAGAASIVGMAGGGAHTVAMATRMDPRDAKSGHTVNPVRIGWNLAKLTGARIGSKVAAPWIAGATNAERDVGQWDAFVKGDYSAIKRDY